MKNKTIKIILISCISLFLNLIAGYCVVNAAEVNDSVELKPAPEVVVPEAPQYHFEFDIPPGGIISGSVSDIEIAEPIPPVEFDVTKLMVISLQQSQELKSDEQLGEDASLVLEMYQGIAKADKISSLVNKDDLTASISGFENLGKIKADDLTVFNIFGVWFPNSSLLRDNEDPTVFITICFNFGEVPNGIYSLIQYDGESYSVIDRSKISELGNGLYNITLNKVAPIALLSVTQETFDNVNNPYYGETLPEVTASFGGLITLEIGGIIFLAIKRKKRLPLLTVVPLFGIDIALSTVIIFIAEFAISTILMILFINLLLDFIRNKKKEKKSSE